MSIFNIQLAQFCLTVPTFVETTSLESIIDLLVWGKDKSPTDFNGHLCAVVDRASHPVGLLHPMALLPDLLLNQPGVLIPDWQKPIGKFATEILEPLIVLPALMEVGDLGEWSKNQISSGRSPHECALVDEDGKFLGLLDWANVIRFLHRYHRSDASPSSANHVSGQRTKTKSESLVKLLEGLPWPLILEDENGEIIAQNPAWWQQLGILKDPDGLHQNVEGIFREIHGQEEHIPATVGKASRNKFVYRHHNNGGIALETLAPDVLNPDTLSNIDCQVSDSPLTNTKQSGNCIFDRSLGTCTCVVDTKTGQEKVWQFAKIPLSHGDGIDSKSSILWLMLATDITEQQLLCQELAAKNADLIQLNRLKDEFLACISHELKTPLTAVLGLSRLLVDQNLGELNERQARYAGLIHQSGRHLMSVVNDILDLTRMETGQMELTLSSVNLQQTCDRAIREAQKNYIQTSKNPNSAPEYQFSLQIEPGLESIVADDLRLRQMLVHLLSNAFKFTEPGGELGLRVMPWEGWIAFTVWDTGIGIPEHQQHLVFQKFQQLENPLTRQFDGTGLGLVLTRALARLHGGDVSFISSEGKGSQFTLLLPPCPHNGELDDDCESLSFPKNVCETNNLLGLGSHPSHNLGSTHFPHSSQRLVLLVEGVGRYIEDLSKQLTELGYRVAIARSGCEALEKARRLQPGVIFINPLLPLLSGWDVLTLVKADGATRHIPIIITGTSADKEQAFANRADGFLNLPVAHTQLQHLLNKIYQQTSTKLSTQSHCAQTGEGNQPLKILRLVSPSLESKLDPLLNDHRVIEVDNLEQAEVLARVWQFNVILLDIPNSAAIPFLEELNQYPRLRKLPLVTCCVETTQAASKIEGISVFPCHSFNQGNSDTRIAKNIASVLQIAAGNFCPPSILTVDLGELSDLPIPCHRTNQPKKTSQQTPKKLSQEAPHEWLQALVQYFQTAGLKATNSHSWSELIEQIHEHRVDLILIYVSESTSQSTVKTACKELAKLSLNLPIAIVWDQNHPTINIDRLNQMTGAIASQIMPRSICMEELLNQVHLILRNP